jgi:hypothetical protein
MLFQFQKADSGSQRNSWKPSIFAETSRPTVPDKNIVSQ